MRNPRLLMAAGALAAVVVVVVLVLALGDSDGGDDEGGTTARARLTLERFEQPGTGKPELLVTLRDRELNVAETTGGETEVLLRCVDAGGAVRLRRPTSWPLLEELGYPLPHIHQVASPSVLAKIRACRLTGPGIDFAGRVPGRLPLAAQ